MAEFTTTDVEQRIIAAAAKQAGVAPETISRVTHFRNDLNFDSLDFVELTMARSRMWRRSRSKQLGQWSITSCGG
jgi:hypothetical protein